MITIYAVFRTTPQQGDLALAMFTDRADAHRFASHIDGRFVDEWQVSNADFMAHEGYPDDEPPDHIVDAMNASLLRRL